MATSYILCGAPSGFTAALSCSTASEGAAALLASSACLLTTLPRVETTPSRLLLKAVVTLEARRSSSLVIFIPYCSDVSRTASPIALRRARS